MRAWVGAVGEWRQMDCAAAGSLTEEGVTEALSDSGTSASPSPSPSPNHILSPSPSPNPYLTADSGVCGEAPWPRMLSAALLSAAPCALPAVRTARVGPFRVKDPA